MFGSLGKALKSKLSGDELEGVGEVYDYAGEKGLNKLLSASEAELTLGVVSSLNLCEKTLTKTKTVSYTGAENTEEDITGRSFSLAFCNRDDNGEEYAVGRYLVSDDDKVIISKAVVFGDLLSVYKEDDLADLVSGGDIGIIKARKRAVREGLDEWFAERYRQRLYMPVQRDGQIVDYYLLSNDDESQTLEIYVYRDSRTEVFTGFIYDADDLIDKVSVEE